jgi:tetratricopeptide (TPR) repeat protein
MARELFRNIPCPVVLFLPEYALTKLARESPDFWAWRSGVFTVAIDKNILSVVMREYTAGRLHEVASLSVASKRRHLDVLKGLLAEYGVAGDQDANTRIDLCYRIGELLWTLGDWNPARHYFTQGLEIARRINDDEGSVARALYYLGILDQDQGDYAAAVENYTQSLKIFKELGNRAGIAGSLHQLGREPHQQREYAAAVKNYTQSLKIYKELGNRAGIAGSLHRLGMVHQDQGDYAAAVENYTQSLKIHKELGNRAGIAASLGQLGIVHQDQGDYAGAIENYLIAHSIFKQLGSPNATIAMNKLSDLREKMGELAFNEAVSAAMKRIDL